MIHKRTKTTATPSRINKVREWIPLDGGGCGSVGVGGSSGTGSGRIKSEHGRSRTNVCVKTGGGCSGLLALTIRRSISALLLTRLETCI